MEFDFDPGVLQVIFFNIQFGGHYGVCVLMLGSGFLGLYPVC